MSLPKTVRQGANDSEVSEHHPDAVHDSVLEATLTHAHALFAFFMGDLWEVWEECGQEVDLFRSRVSEFYSKYLPGLRSALSSSNSPSVLDLFHAVQFLTLDSGAFLRVRCFVGRVREEFPIVGKVVFFQQVSAQLSLKV